MGIGYLEGIKRVRKGKKKAGSGKPHAKEGSFFTVAALKMEGLLE